MIHLFIAALMAAGALIIGESLGEIMFWRDAKAAEKRNKPTPTPPPAEPLKKGWENGMPPLDRFTDSVQRMEVRENWGRHGHRGR